MKLDDAKIKDILTKEDYVSQKDMKQAEVYARTHRTSLVEYLMTAKLISKELLGQAIAESFGVVYADLTANPPSKDTVLKIPEEIARKYNVLIYTISDKSITIATNNPTQENLLPMFKANFPGKNIVIAYAFSEDIENIFIHYRKSLEARFIKIIKSQGGVAPEIIGEIVEDIIAFRASDIHFEPQDKEVVIRFRVDGVMHEAGRIPKEYYENILNWIKVQADLRIDEHYSAQDGAMRYKKNNIPIDMRVSVVPILDGEKVSIRVMSQYVQNFTLSDLGFSSTDQKMITDAAKKPFGMILVTGPTGSGKTTTLYALLKILNRVEVNITTIEDPVEYKIMGVNQIRVNQKTDLTFAKGLRSIVRQDPDIILVGEIRDNETAEISVNAALTGHLLLSTFHSNDSATSIPRLLDMKVEPFLLASTIEIIIAQRLVRKICTNCRTSKQTSITGIKKLFPQADQYFTQKTVNLYRGKGCDVCSGTGYKGRTAIFEIIQMNKELKDLVLKNPSTNQIWEIASKYGSRSLFADGIDKVKSGVTTINELLRVAEPNHVSNTN